MAEDLRVTCSDRGQHPGIELARFAWQPSGGWAVWDPEDPPGDAELRPVGEDSRETRGGGTKRTTRTAVNVIDRSDGGRTFVITCPRCRREIRVRAEGLELARRAGVHAIDWSLR